MASTGVASSGGTSRSVPVGRAPACGTLLRSAALLGSPLGTTGDFSKRMVGFSVWAFLAAWSTGRLGARRYEDGIWDSSSSFIMCGWVACAVLSLLLAPSSMKKLSFIFLWEWYKIVFWPMKLLRFFVVWSKLRDGGPASLLEVCGQRAYLLKDNGALKENRPVVTDELLSGPSPAWASRWVSFTSDPVFQGVWSVAGPVCRARQGGPRGTVFVSQEGTDDEEFDNQSGTLYSERFNPGLLICRSGWVWIRKPRRGSGLYVNRPREVHLKDVESEATQGSGQVSRKLVVWGSNTESYWDYLAIVGVVNTLSLLIVILAGGYGTDVAVVFSINLGTELLAVALCVREVVMCGHRSLRLGSALDPVSALRFLSSSSMTVFLVLFLEVVSALGGMIYLGTQDEWALVAVGGCISVIGCAVSVVLLPARARWLSAALVLYTAEFVVEIVLVSRSTDPILLVVLGTSIFETVELAALLIFRIGFGAFKLQQSKTQGDLHVALECDAIATGESCNWGLGLALGRGMVSSKVVPTGKIWPKELSVTRGTNWRRRGGREGRL